MLWLRTILFTFVVPGTVLGVIPYLLWRSTGRHWDPGIIQQLGYGLILPGSIIILRCFIDFVRIGRGTPAPFDPPRHLVTTGLYRRVRNPQYIGVVLVATGEAILSGSWILAGYAAFLALGYHSFVRLYEERALTRSFGDEYLRYTRSVPRWIPRHHADHRV